MRTSRAASRWPIVLLVLVQVWFAAGSASLAFGDVMPLTRVLAGLLAAFFAYRVLRNVRELIDRTTEDQDPDAPPHL